MDFQFPSDTADLIDLADRILGDASTAERLSRIEHTWGRFDPDLWHAVLEAGLIEAVLPTSVGGAGLGVVGAAQLCRQVGIHAAATPIWSTLMLAALPMALLGDSEQSAGLIGRVLESRGVMSAAVSWDLLESEAGFVAATRVGSDWELSGIRSSVPSVHLVALGVEVLVLIPALLDGEVKVFALDVDRDGVSVTANILTDGDVVSTVVLERASAVLLEADGLELLKSILQIGSAGICARQAGTCASALRLAATYTSEREQFGSKLATFQAVAHRMADAYIDTEGVELTALYAAWLLDSGERADEAVAVAKVWACEGAQRVVHGAQHVHGGIGVDTDYPLYRFFRAAKTAEHFLGTAHPHLLFLGHSCLAQLSDD